MAEPKTKITEVSPLSFLNAIDNAQQRDDSFKLLAIMKEITGLEPKMWGPSIVGFGEYHYVYDSGHEGDCCLVGFSPRKGKMSLYIMPGGVAPFAAQLKQLGKHKAGKGCLYINKLADVNEAVLRQIITVAFQESAKQGQHNQRAAPAKETKGRSKKGKGS